MKNALFLFGPPGCGKGTQASHIKAHFKCDIITTGDLLRKEVSAQTTAGVSISNAIKAGKLVDSEIVEKLMLNAIESSQSNLIVFDGYPRSLEQYDQLCKIQDNCKLHIAGVINFVIPLKLLIERVVHRFSCAKCGAIYHKLYKQTSVENVCDHCGSTEFTIREDDNEDVVTKRFDTFTQETQPVLQKFASLVHNLDASQSVNHINQSITNILSALPC